MNKNINVVTVIGAGFMGDQIIRKTALKDYTVRFYDVNPKGCEKLANSLTRKRVFPFFLGLPFKINTLTIIAQYL